MTIWIEPYYRIRFGKLEQVRGHWRSMPLTATLVPKLGLAFAKR